MRRRENTLIGDKNEIKRPNNEDSADVKTCCLIQRTADWGGGAFMWQSQRNISSWCRVRLTLRWGRRGRGHRKGLGCGCRMWQREISSYTTKWGENVIGLYQQGVNILAQGGFTVAKQQEQRNQFHFCCSKRKKIKKREMGLCVGPQMPLFFAVVLDQHQPPLTHRAEAERERPGWIIRRVKTLRLLLRVQTRFFS